MAERGKSDRVAGIFQHAARPSGPPLVGNSFSPRQLRSFVVPALSRLLGFYKGRVLRISETCFLLVEIGAYRCHHSVLTRLHFFAA